MTKTTSFHEGVDRDEGLPSPRARRSDSPLGMMVAAKTADITPDASSRADLEKRLERAARMLDLMSARDREVFLLATIDELTYQGIATKLNMTIKQVRDSLQRGYDVCSKHAEAETKRAKKQERRQRRIGRRRGRG